MFDCYRELCEKGRKHFAALLFYFYYFLFFFFCLDFNARFLFARLFVRRPQKFFRFGAMSFDLARVLHYNFEAK